MASVLIYMFNKEASSFDFIDICPVFSTKYQEACEEARGHEGLNKTLTKTKLYAIAHGQLIDPHDHATLNSVFDKSFIVIATGHKQLVGMSKAAAKVLTESDMTDAGWLAKFLIHEFKLGKTGSDPS
ncbi:hypothetical protein LPJ60_005670, partial [Coemansia sp. RSA 2675]